MLGSVRSGWLIPSGPCQRLFDFSRHRLRGEPSDPEEDSMSRLVRSRSRLAVAGVAAAASLLLAACGSSGAASGGTGNAAGTGSSPGTAGSGNVVNLTFWSWVPGIQTSVNLWNKTHPDIQVHLDETTSGTAGTYAKMFSALKAGNAPDLGQVEYSVLPNFEHVGGLDNIAPYVNGFKKDFLGWTWNQVSLGSDVFAVPQDVGPEALFYRADLFKKYGLAVPTTWQQYLSDAEKLHAANPNAYIAAFPAADTQWFAGLAWQAGSDWFTTSGNSWLVNFTSNSSAKVASLWQELISKHLVKVEPDFANGWYKDLSDGTLLTWPSAVWGESTLMTNAASTKGDWRVAPLPSWGSTPSDGDYGGSTTVVFKDSKHPKQAAEFAAWLNTNQQSITSLITKGGLYPADAQGEKQSADNSPVAFYGGQNIWKVFAQGAAEVNTNFRWGPIMSTTFTQLGDAFSAAAAGSGTLSSALSKAQSETLSTMKQQGFAVKAG
ncbi:extracellular solute-binding protein [Acidimicrobiaceae bacterium USS-CC1]|uniref:Extracellular solute-binding protein n=1 Tax=Acidiferrimicrobium australe TaxID=2664430 RepID=A0ABW9QSC1_9ACTN|nr:extracellular solute-binding protein [Acidiferrimicrobium australe]